MIYDGLVPEFRDRLDVLEKNCATEGVIMRPYFGLRDPVTQAKLWRQSRSHDQVVHAEQRLVDEAAPFLAECLTKAGPQPNGPWKTNALPGQSWHQWGEAMDYVWMVDGKECWTVSSDPKNGYRVLARYATALGLTSGMSFGDNDHVQFRSASSPERAGLTMAQIDAAMKAKFGDALA